MTKQKRDELLGRLGVIEDVLSGTTSTPHHPGVYARRDPSACIRILRDVLADVVREMATAEPPDPD